VFNGPFSATTQWWDVGVVICLKRGAHLHMAQLMPLPLTVSCFCKIQIGFTFLVPSVSPSVCTYFRDALVLAHAGSPRQRAIKRVCVCVCVWKWATCFCIVGFLTVQERFQPVEVRGGIEFRRRQDADREVHRQSTSHWGPGIVWSAWQCNLPERARVFNSTTEPESDRRSTKVTMMTMVIAICYIFWFLS